MKRLLGILCILVYGMTASHAQSTKERLSEHVYRLASDSLAGRAFGTLSGLRAAGYVASQFAGAGLETYGNESYLHPFEAGERKGYNVIGILRGSDPGLKDEWLIIGAHFDHLGVRMSDSVIHHGADDNASGTAALIEIARNLAPRRAELQRSVMFVAFDGEERGLFGSAHLAKNPPEGEVKFMASIDMVGWLREGKRLKIAGVAMLNDGKQIFQSAATSELELNLKRFDTFILGGSDHEPFALDGVPAMYITTGLKSPYHKPEDTADKIDYEGLTLVTDYLTAATAQIASREVLEPSGKRSFKHKTEPLFAVGVTVSVGNNQHLYKKGALDGKAAAAWNVGLYAHLNFGKWAVRPKIAYEQRNAKWPVDFASRTSTTLRTGGLYVPIDVMYKMRAMGMENVYFYLFAGGYYSRVLGKIEGNSVDFSTIGAMRRNEWGWQFGGGLSIYKFWLESGGRYGLTEIFSDGGIRNRSGYFSVGYRF